MVMEFILGQTAENMKEIIRTIKSMGVVHILGLMEESILESGKMTRDTDVGNTLSTSIT